MIAPRQNGSVFDASISDLTLFGQAFCATFSEYATPAVQEVDDGSAASPPFSIVFNIVGSCRECGQATVVFGNHAEVSPGETTSVSRRRCIPLSR